MKGNHFGMVALFIIWEDKVVSLLELMCNANYDCQIALNMIFDEGYFV